MPGDTPSPEPEPEPEQDETDTDFVEVDPTGRYGRYSEVLGKGAFKTVYKAFDELEGIEVAWNQVKLADVLRNADDLERLYSEVHLLKTLKHKNIIKFYTSWVDTINDNINLITEVFTSGTLRQYRKKHKHVDTRALKNWSRQILSGLLYLHSHDPPVIHRDLKCDNIFVNGNQGMVKLGDLGLAAILRHAQLAHSVIGTPEFMAPELYEEEYNELVDIYAFGMSLLELVTFEYPYAECSNAAQIYKKVISGIKPASLTKVKDPAVRQFIEKCIANVSERLSARELLRDPFLHLDVENESIGHSLPRELNHVDNVGHPNARTNDTYNNESYMNGRDFTLEGQRKDINTIFLKLHIADSTGQFHNLHFPFNIEDDTSISVATEMVAELDLADHDVTAIAEIIDAEIQAHIPEWVPGEALEDQDNEVIVQDKYDLEAEDEIFTLANESDHHSGGLVLERLSSGRKYWSDSPKGTATDSPSRLAHSNFSSEINSHDSDDLSVDACEKIDRSSKHDDCCDYCSYGTSASKQKKGSTHFIDHGEDNLESITLSASFELPSLVPKYMGNQNQEGECSFKCINNKNRSIADEHEGDDGSLYKTILENEPKNVKSVSKKLKHILVEQQKELEELKKKHEMAISDIVKELPPELRKRTLSMFHLKIPDYKMDMELEEHPGHSSFSVSSLLEALPSYTDKSLMDG